MPYQTYTMKIDVTAVDIPSMAEMSTEAYREYLDGGLFHVDHHDILRSGPADYPVAVTKAQLRILIDYLEGLESKVGAGL